MNCKNCNCEIKEENIFCPHCGAKNEQTVLNSAETMATQTEGDNESVVQPSNTFENETTFSAELTENFLSQNQENIVQPQKSNKIILFICLIAVLLIAIGAGVSALVYFNKPETKLKMAITNTTDNITSEWTRTAENAFNSKALVSLFEKTTETNFNFSIKEAGEDAVIFNSIGLEVTAKQNKKDKISIGDIRVNFLGEKIDAKVQANKDVISFSAPSLLEKTYGVDFNTKYEDVNPAFEIDKQDYSLITEMSLWDTEKIDTNIAIYKVIYKNVNDLFISSKPEMKKATQDILGVEQQGEVLKVHLTEQDIQNFGKTTTKELLEVDEEYVIAFLNSNNIDDTIETADQALEYVEMQLEDCGGIDVEFFIKDKAILKMQISNDENSIEVMLSEGKNPLAKAQISDKEYFSDGELFYEQLIEIEKQEISADSEKITLKVCEDVEYIGDYTVVEFFYDKSIEKDNFALTLENFMDDESTGDKMTFAGDAIYTNKSVEFDLYKCSFEELGETMLKFELLVGIKEGEISQDEIIKDEDVVNVLTMTEEQVIELTEEFSESVDEILYSMLSNYM